MQEIKEGKNFFFLKVNLPNRAKVLKSPNFEGVFMRNESKRGPKYRESTVINLDNSRGPGTHV